MWEESWEADNDHFTKGGWHTDDFKTDGWELTNEIAGLTVHYRQGNDVGFTLGSEDKHRRRRHRYVALPKGSEIIGLRLNSSTILTDLTLVTWSKPPYLCTGFERRLIKKERE